MHQHCELLGTDTSITYINAHWAHLSCRLATVVCHLPAWLLNNSGLYAASEVKAIVGDEAASVSRESDNYWVLAAALKRYLDNEGNGQLPIEVYAL